LLTVTGKHAVRHRQNKGSAATHLRCGEILVMVYHKLFANSDNKRILKIG